MIENVKELSLNHRKLRHDFANDIGILKMNVEALRLLRENPEECEDLLQLMQDSINTLEVRLMKVLDLMATTDSQA